MTPDDVLADLERMRDRLIDLLTDVEAAIAALTDDDASAHRVH